MTSPDATTTRPEPYRPSGRVAWARFLSLALATLVVAVLAAAGMHFVFRYRLYLPVVVLVFAVLPLFGAVHLAVRLGKCRWWLPAVALGAIAAIVLYLGFYYVGMVDDAGWRVAHRFELLPHYVAFRQRTAFDDVSDGWALFAAEFLTTTFVLVLAGFDAWRRPFCERCGEWMIHETVAFHADDARQIVEQLQEAAPVLTAPAIEGVPAERDYAAVTVACCPRVREACCGAYVSVRQVRSDQSWGGHLLKRAGLSCADLHALAPRFPALALVTGIVESRMSAAPEASWAVGDVRPVPPPYVGRVLSRRHLALNTLSMLSSLLAIVGGTLAALVGAAMLRDPGAAPLAGALDPRFWLIAGGAFLGVVGLVALVFRPSWLGGDLIPRIVRREFATRSVRLVDSDDPAAELIEVVRPKSLTRGWGETATDVGFLVTDDDSREVRFEGDREYWRIPGEAILACDLKELHLPPRSSHPTAFHLCLLRVRLPDGERQILLAPRVCTGLALLTMRRRHEAVSLHARLSELSRPPGGRAGSVSKAETSTAGHLSVEFAPTIEDVAAALTCAIESRSRQSNGEKRKIYLTVGLTVVAVLLTTMLAYHEGRISLGWMLLWDGLLLSFVALCVMIPRWLARLNSPEALRRRLGSLSDAERAEILARRTVSLTADGLCVQMGDRVLEVPWRQVGKVARTVDHVFLFDAPGSVIVVPRSAFRSSDAFRQFGDQAESRALPPTE